MLKQVTLENFVGFESFEAKFTGVNVIIGTNDSGKASLLKLLYAVSRTLEAKKSLDAAKPINPLPKALSQKLMNTFQPQGVGLGDLVMKGHAKMHGWVSYDFSKKAKGQTVSFTLHPNSVDEVEDCTPESHLQLSEIGQEFNAIFLPNKEILTAFGAIAATRRKLDLIGFDDTYLDLIDNLSLPYTSGKTPKNLTDIKNSLQGLFEGQIEQDKGKGTEVRFVFNKNGVEFEMPQTAEGIKKIGILTTLIRNRTLNKGTMLFMDEPETALHPKAVRELAKIIFNLSKAHVQVFISTHNYFLIKQISLIAQRESLPTRFISLVKSPEEPIAVEVNDLANGLPSNPIIDEALALYDEDVKQSLGMP